MKTILLFLLTLSISGLSQEADLSDLEDIRVQLNHSWALDEDANWDSQFQFLFIEDLSGQLTGANVPYNALTFELILDKEIPTILWFNSSGRCVSSAILEVGEFLELEFKEEIIGFERRFRFRTIGCPSF